MNEKTIQWIKSVAFTTTLTFTLITFFYFLMLTLTGDRAGGTTSIFTFFSYTLGKLFCIFLFSLILGFANRLFQWNKPHALLRLIHFIVTLLGYVLTLILLFYTMFDVSGLTTQGVLLNLILFFVFYPLVLGVSALGRALFLPKEKKAYRNILD